MLVALQSVACLADRVSHTVLFVVIAPYQQRLASVILNTYVSGSRTLLNWRVRASLHKPFGALTCCYMQAPFGKGKLVGSWL